MFARFLLPGIILVVPATLAPPAAAQHPPSFFMEASVGVGLGSGGDYDHRVGNAADLMLGLRLDDTAAGTVGGALSVGLNGAMAVDLGCRLRAEGDGAPAFPLLISGGALAGLERRYLQGAAARVLAGPAFYSAVDGGEAFGLQARVDIASPTFVRTALVASLRSILLPRFDGETLGVTALGLGLRIQ